MSAHKFVWPLFLLGFVTAACEEKSAPPEATPAEAPKAAEVAPAEAPKAPEASATPAGAPSAPVAAAKEAAIVGPQEVCGALIEAAKSKDEARILALSTPATATAFNAEGAKDHILTTLAGASCTSAKIEGDAATVTLGGTKPAQEASFSKSVDGWKFDGAAFLAKYPAKVIKEKSKKAAATVKGHANKAAASKKHHHDK